MIDLYTAATPNGHKISIALEELASPYTLHALDLSNKDQKQPWFLAMMFQMGGVGPMMGQANVFFRYFPEKIQPAIDRYQGESKRLFRVLDRHLKDHEFLAGEYSIADCGRRTQDGGNGPVASGRRVMARSAKRTERPYS